MLGSDFRVSVLAGIMQISLLLLCMHAKADFAFTCYAELVSCFSSIISGNCGERSQLDFVSKGNGN
jgi:hypothetical protein